MNLLSTFWTDNSARMVDQLVTAAWQGGLALFLVWGLCCLWRSCAPRVRCWLWRIAFAKLLLALVWINPWQLPILPAEPAEEIAQVEGSSSRPPQRNNANTGTQRRTADGIYAIRQNADMFGSVSKTHSNPTQSSTGNAGTHLFTQDNAGQAPATHFADSDTTQFGTSTGAPTTAEPRDAEAGLTSGWLSTLNLRAVLMCIWATGVLVGLGCLARQLWTSHRLRRGAVPLDSTEVLELKQDTASALALRRAPEVRTSTDVAGPMLTGVLRPVVLLPARWQASPRPEHLRMALTHEYAHIRRRDLLWNWLPALARIVFWFHPLVWIASRQWSLDVEEACDELAVNDGRLPRVRYAEFLVWIVAPRHPGYAPMTLGAASPFSHLKRRLLTMKKRSNQPRRLWLAVAGCGTLGLAVLAPVQLTAQDAPPDPAQQSQGGGGGGGRGGGGTVQSQGSGQSQGVGQSKGTIQSAGGGGGTVVQGQNTTGTVQSAGSGGGTVVQGQNTTGTVRSAGVGQSAGGGGGGTVVQGQTGSGTVRASSNRGGGVQSQGGGGGGTVSSAGRNAQSVGSGQGGGAGQTFVRATGQKGGAVTFGPNAKINDAGTITISVTKDGKTLTISAKPSLGKFPVTVSRKEGNTTVSKDYEIENIGELKDLDEEAFEVYTSHVHGGHGDEHAHDDAHGDDHGDGHAGQTVGGHAGAGSRAGFGTAGGGSGSSGFGRAGAGGGSGSGGFGRAGGGGGFGRAGAGGSASGGRGGFGGTASRSSSGSGGGRFGGAGSGSSRGLSTAGSTDDDDFSRLLSELTKLREKYADNTEMIKALDKLEHQLIEDHQSKSDKGGATADSGGSGR